MVRAPPSISAFGDALMKGVVGVRILGGPPSLEIPGKSARVIMERHRKQIASTLVLASFLIVAAPVAVLLPPLCAQARNSSKAIDPDLRARANAGDAGAELLVGLAYVSNLL